MSAGDEIAQAIIGVSVQDDGTAARLGEIFNSAEADLQSFVSKANSVAVGTPFAELATQVDSSATSVDALARNIEVLGRASQVFAQQGGSAFLDVARDAELLIARLEQLRSLSGTVGFLQRNAAGGLYPAEQIQSVLTTRGGAYEQLQARTQAVQNRVLAPQTGVDDRLQALGITERDSNAVQIAGRNLISATDRLALARKAAAESESDLTGRVAAGEAAVFRAQEALAKAYDAHLGGGYYTPSLATRLESLGVQESDSAAVQVASRNLVAATDRLADVMGEGAGKQATAEAAVIRAQEQLARAYEKQAEQQDIAAGGGSGGRGFFGAAFAGSGGQGGGGSDILDQAGFAFRYYAYYKVFELGADLVKRVKEETAAYATATTQLGFALRGTSADAAELAPHLANIATNLGSKPEVGITSATTFIRAFQGQADPRALAQLGATAGGTLGVLGDPEKVAENLKQIIAIAQSFDLGPGGVQTILDSGTKIAQRYGLDNVASILPGVGQIADLGKSSGFSVEQTEAIIANIQQKTGESSDAAAGELRRFLGRSGNAAFQGVFAGYGINTNQSLAGELSQLGPRFNGLPESEQARIISTLGGGRAGAAVAATLTDYNNTVSLTNPGSAASQGAGATGEAAKQANAQLQNFAGQLKLIDAEFNALAKNLGSSGLLTPLGLLLGATKDLLTILNALLDVFNEIPASIRPAVAVIAEFALAARLIGTDRVAAFSSRITGLGGGGGAAEEVNAARALTGSATALDESAAALRGAAVAQEGGAAAAVGEESAIAATSVRGLAGAALAAYGPLAALAVGIVAVNTILNRIDQEHQDQANVDSAASIRAKAVTPEAKQAADRALLGAAGTQSDDNSGIVNYMERTVSGAVDKLKNGSILDRLREATNFVTPGGIFEDQGDAGQRNQQDAINQAQRDFAQKDIARQQALINQRRATGTGYFNNGVSGGINQLLVDGSSDKRILSNLLPFLQNGDAGTSSSLAALFNPDTSKNTPGLGELLTAASKQAKTGGVEKDVLESLRKVQQAGQEGLQLVKQSPDSDKYIGKAQEIADKANDEYFTELNKATKAKVDAIRASAKLQDRSIQKNVTDRNEAAKQINAVDANSSAEIRNILKSTVIQELSAGDVNAAANALKGMDGKTITVIRNSIISMQNAAKQAIAEAEHVYEAAIQAAAAAAQSTPGGPNADDVISDESNRGRARDHAPGVAAQSNRLASLQRALDNLDKAGKISSLSGSSLPGVGSTSPGGGSGGGGGTGDTAAEIAAARYLSQADVSDPVSIAKEDVKAAAIKLDSDKKNTVAFYNDLRSYHEAQKALKDAINDVTVAKDLAAAVSDDNFSQASAAMKAAKATLLNDKKGTAKYYTDLKAYHDAQQQWVQVVQEASNDSVNLTIDQTNPVAVANEKLREARAKLLADRRRGASQYTINKDQLDVNSATNDAQGAAFQQQFSDFQTNYNLNRISYATYVKYLQSQHDVLTATKNKTRQQIDELNQVDEALKAAKDQLDGQFNIGDIKVPTVYQVRRSIAQQTAANGAVGSGATIYIDGADTGYILSILNQYVGTARVASVSPSADRKI